MSKFLQVNNPDQLIHTLLYLEADMERAKLRLFKLEQRGRPDRLLVWGNSQVFNESVLYNDLAYGDESLKQRYWYIFRQMSRFWQGIVRQYGVF